MLSQPSPLKCLGFLLLCLSLFTNTYSSDHNQPIMRVLAETAHTIDFHQRDQSMPRCGARNMTTSMTDGQTYLTVYSQMRPYKILISTSTSYLPIFLNWLIYFHNICGSDMSAIHLICLDKDIEANIKRYGLKCSFVHYLPDTRQAFNRLWLIRGQVAKDLLSSGYDVLMSDSDALWLRNPFYDIEYYAANSDIIGTRATFPEEVQARLGATLCMGFIYIKSSTEITTLWDELLDHMVKLPNPDDQKILNEIMMRQKVKFSHRLAYQKSFEVDHGYFLIAKKKIRLSILPQNSYRRICFPKILQQMLTNTTILHCVTMAKSQRIKRLAGEKYGLWLLNESALSTPSFGFKKHPSFDAFITSISLNSPDSIIKDKFPIS